MNIIHDIQRILSNWSKTLEIDDLSGETIVTQESLDRLGNILSRYFEETIRQIQISNSSITKSPMTNDQ